jgi:hypothetical protein
MLAPVVKVATNIAGETGTYTFGGFRVFQLLHAVMTKGGLDKLDLDTRDVIARSMKKGAIGLALAAYAWNNADQFGGLYDPEDKHRKGLKPGEMKIAGYNIPRWAQHSPIAIHMQLWASLRKLYDESQKKGSKKFLNPLKTFYFVAHEVPFFNSIEDFDKLTSSSKKTFAKSAVRFAAPSSLRQVAQWTDQWRTGVEDREPKTMLDEVRNVVPIWRESVPPKKKKLYQH